MGAMRNLRRMIPLLAAVILLLALSACGNGTEEPAKGVGEGAPSASDAASDPAFAPMPSPRAQAASDTEGAYQVDGIVDSFRLFSCLMRYIVPVFPLFYGIGRLASFCAGCSRGSPDRQADAAFTNSPMDLIQTAFRSFCRG